MGYFVEKRKHGVKNIEFPGVSKQRIPVVNLKRSWISLGKEEIIMWNFKGSWFLALEFTRDLTLFYGIPRGKLKILKTPGGSKKVCPQPLLFSFFLE